MNTTTQLFDPAREYPAEVSITEDGHTLRFVLAHFETAIYCAIYHDGKLAHQTGARHQQFLKALGRDIAKAKTRGATIEIGSIICYRP